MKKIATLTIAIVVLFSRVGYSETENSRTVEYPTRLSLDSQSKSTSLKYEPVLNLIYLPGKLNSTDACWFTLDTGFPYTLVNRDRLDTSRVTLGSGHMDLQPGGEVEMQAAYDIQIEIGGVSIHADSIRSFPFSGLEPIIGHRFDGIIGHDLFEKYVVTIDYIEHTITIEEADDFSYAGTGTEIEVVVIEGEAFIFAEIKHPDGTWRKAKLKLDTGSADFVGFNGWYIQAQHLVPDDQPKIPATGSAAGGETENWVTRLDEFRISDFHFSHPIVGYSVDTLRGGDAGTIGAEFLSRFTVVFDYPRNRIILEPNNNYYNTFDFDMSGIFPIAQAPDYKTKVVLATEPGSPAADAGIAAGDILISINDIDCTKLSIGQIREKLKTAGTVILVVQTDTITRTVELNLQPLI